MRIKVMICLALLAGGSLTAGAQSVSSTASGVESRAPLEGQPVALDSMGRAALAGQLLTRALSGTPDTPVKNVRFIVENRSPFYYNYVSGSVTFYDERGVRCGEGQFALNALAPGEQVETDAPGLRLACNPVTWRLVANNLLTRASQTAPPVVEETQPEMPAPPVAPSVLPLEIVVDDQVYTAPLGSTLDVSVRKRRVKITVRAAQ